MHRAMPIDLTTIDPATITPPPEGERLLRDTTMPGLALRLRATGARTWVLFSPTEPKRRTLGDATVIPLDLARRMCATPSSLSGRDQQPLSSPHSARSSVAALMPHFLAAGAAGRWKPSTLRNMRAVSEVHILPALGSRIVRDLKPEDITRWHLDVRAKSSAERMALSTLSGLMLYAEDHGLRAQGSNPCRGLSKKARGFREHALTGADIRRLWSALDRLQPRLPDVCDAIRLLLLTGARRSEILGLEWDRVAGSRAILEDSKSGSRTLWLNAPARALLDKRRAEIVGPFVFPNTDGDRPITAIDRGWKAIRAEARLGGVRVHDLRHHFASVAVSNGVDLRIVGQLLGHHDLNTTLGYAHLAKSSLAQSATRVSGIIDAALRRRSEAISIKHPGRSGPKASSTATPEVQHA